MCWPDGIVGGGNGGEYGGGGGGSDKSTGGDSEHGEKDSMEGAGVWACKGGLM